MAYPQDKGQTNKVHNTGEIVYGGDGTNFYPLYASTTELGTSAKLGIALPEYFIFRPGAAALASGMVPAGTRSAAGTITSGASANVTYWGPESTYAPVRTGKIDGLAASGIVSGQITIGHKSAAGTVNAKVTIRGRNTTGADTTTVVLLALQAATSVTTAETFATYDIPYLYTTSNFNQVPFAIQMGIETAVAASATIGRIMSSSFIEGSFEPGT